MSESHLGCHFPKNRWKWRVELLFSWPSSTGFVMWSGPFVNSATATLNIKPLVWYHISPATALYRRWHFISSSKLTTTGSVALFRQWRWLETQVSQLFKFCNNIKVCNHWWKVKSFSRPWREQFHILHNIAIKRTVMLEGICLHTTLF